MFDNSMPFTSAQTTAALAVGTTSTEVTLPLVNSVGLSPGKVQALLVNIGPNAIAVSLGAGAAVFPVPGTPSSSVVLPPSSSQTFTIPDGATIEAIAAATGNSLYISVGAGF
jgi:hypothetical protein